MQTIPFSEVRARLADTLRVLAHSDDPVFISRRGEPAAVLLSVAQYQRLTHTPVQDPWSALQAWRSQYAIDSAPADDPDPFADVRDRSLDGGRDVAWPDEDTGPA
jgi:prevent-host-death family protein